VAVPDGPENPSPNHQLQSSDDLESWTVESRAPPPRAPPAKAITQAGEERHQGQ